MSDFTFPTTYQPNFHKFVLTRNDLPMEGNEENDTRYVEADGVSYAWLSGDWRAWPSFTETARVSNAEQRKERFVEFHRLLAAYNHSRFSPSYAVREAALEELTLFAVGPKPSTPPNATAPENA